MSTHLQCGAQGGSGREGYQPLVAFCPEIGMVPWLEARDGNVPAAMDNERGLRETLLVLAAAGYHLMAARQRMILTMPPPAPSPG